MIDPSSHLLSFVNRVRAVQELEPLRFLVMLGAETGDEDGCLLAQATRCAVGGATDSTAASSGGWVLRLGDPQTARLVALEVGQPWHPEHCEVELASEVADFAVSFDVGEVEPDEMGFVRASRVPVDGNDPKGEMLRFELPGMEASVPELVVA